MSTSAVAGNCRCARAQARARNIAYLIAVHAEPERLGRLVRALATPWSRFFVHVDAHVPVEPFAEHVAGIPGVVLLENRVRVNWGGFSQVDATLRMLQTAMESDETAPRYVLLSGACYPVAGNLAVREVLCTGETEYIQSQPMPDPECTKAITRLTRWHFEGGQRRKGVKATLIRALNGAVRHGPNRDLGNAMEGLAPHCGSNWWALSDLAVHTILDTVNARPKFVEFLRNADCPDECFFQTILANSELAPRLSRSLTFADWTVKGRGPQWIDAHHLDWLLDGGAPPPGIADQPYLFARKFSSANAHLLNRIDTFRLAQDAAIMRSTLITALPEPALARKAAIR